MRKHSHTHPIPPLATSQFSVALTHRSRWHTERVMCNLVMTSPRIKKKKKILRKEGNVPHCVIPSFHFIRNAGCEKPTCAFLRVRTKQSPRLLTFQKKPFSTAFVCHNGSIIQFHPTDVFVLFLKFQRNCWFAAFYFLKPYPLIFAEMLSNPTNKRTVDVS